MYEHEIKNKETEEEDVFTREYMKREIEWIKKNYTPVFSLKKAFETRREMLK